MSAATDARLANRILRGLAYGAVAGVLVLVLAPYIPGLQDFKLTINAWYDTAYAVLETMSKNKTSEYFQLYPDFADTLNYYRGQCYVGLDGLPLDLGNTADLTFTSTIANADIAIIRGGAAI